MSFHVVPMPFGCMAWEHWSIVFNALLSRGNTWDNLRETLDVCSAGTCSILTWPVVMVRIVATNFDQGWSKPSQISAVHVSWWPSQLYSWVLVKSSKQYTAIGTKYHLFEPCEMQLAELAIGLYTDAEHCTEVRISMARADRIKAYGWTDNDIEVNKQASNILTNQQGSRSIGLHLQTWWQANSRSQMYVNLTAKKYPQ